jgi:uncharacterized phosphatase
MIMSTTDHKTIGLIRHGETDWNIERRMQGQENIPLNEQGQRQSRELGQLIATMDWTWDVIVSSPLQRALDTAQAINDFIGPKEIVILNQFMELDFGQASGLTRDEAKSSFPDGQIPDLESPEQLMSRVVDGLKYLFDSIAATHILLVTHGEVLRTIYKLIGHTHKVSQKPGNASLDVITLHLAQL